VLIFQHAIVISASQQKGGITRLGSGVGVKEPRHRGHDMLAAFNLRNDFVSDPGSHPPAIPHRGILSAAVAGQR